MTTHKTLPLVVLPEEDKLCIMKDHIKNYMEDHTFTIALTICESVKYSLLLANIRALCLQLKDSANISNER